uniref:Intermediate filament family orphan 1-like n=1 Tax=Pundamilia nyererei TaxID=303518 RepID=A0A3B4EZM4_9CICH
MNPVLEESGFLAPQQQHPQMPSQTDSAIPDPGYFLGDHGRFGLDGLSGLDLGALPPSGLAYLHLSSPLHRVPPAATALRNDLGSNISVLKTLNLRFRCFLAKVHELERRNKVLEKQLQQALEGNSGGDGHQKPLTKDIGVQTGFIGPIPARPGFIPLLNANNSAYLPALSPMDPTKTITNINEKYSTHTGTNTSNAPPPPPPPPRFLPGTIWSFNHTRRFGTGRESCVTGPGVSWTHPDGVGVQIDTITPEIRALYNVLAKVKRERDEYKRRWEEEYTARMDLQEKVAELEEDLQESEVCQDELALRVKRLKEELVLFKGLVSNNLSDLDTKIQEKAMKVDMDICRRIDITARLCDVAQQRNCEDMNHIFQVDPRKHSGQSLKGGDGDELSVSESEGGGAKSEDSCSTSANQINEQMQKMLNQLRECEFEDDCDSLAWEETEETLLLWEDFPGYTLGVEPQGEVRTHTHTRALTGFNLIKCSLLSTLDRQPSTETKQSCRCAYAKRHTYYYSSDLLLLLFSFFLLCGWVWTSML